MSQVGRPVIQYDKDSALRPACLLSLDVTLVQCHVPLEPERRVDSTAVSVLFVVRAPCRVVLLCPCVSEY